MPGPGEMAPEPEDDTDPDAPVEPSIEFSPDPSDEAPAAKQAGDFDAAGDAEQAGDAEDADAALADALATDTLTADTLPGVPPVGWADEGADTVDTAPGSAYPAGHVEAEPHQRPADPHPGDGRQTVAVPATPSAETRSPELFDIEAEEDDEFIEQLRQVVSSDAPLPSADAAMAAFFDHDEGGGRGGRLGQRA